MIYFAEAGLSSGKKDKKRFVCRASPSAKNSCAMMDVEQLVDVSLTDGVGVRARQIPK